MEDYKQTYTEFWKEIVEKPDGTLNVDQVKRELHDYHELMEQAGKVYDHVTGGVISKVNAAADCVIAEHDRAREREIAEAIQDQ